VNPEELKLPELEPTVFASSVFLRKEWVMDPPPFIARRLPEELLSQIYKIKIQGLSQIAEFQSQINAVEARVFGQIAEILP
jgi:hypothetical protein